MFFPKGRRFICSRIISNEFQFGTQKKKKEKQDDHQFIKIRNYEWTKAVKLGITFETYPARFYLLPFQLYFWFLYLSSRLNLYRDA